MKDQRKGNSLFDSRVCKTDNWGKNKKQIKRKPAFYIHKLSLFIMNFSRGEKVALFILSSMRMLQQFKHSEEGKENESFIGNY